MVRFLIAFSIAFAAGLGTAQADDDRRPGDPPAATQDNQTRLDALFQDLRKEENEQAARRIAARIGRALADSGSDTASLLMGWANDAIKAEKFSVALDFLDQVTILFPAYAEGWNRRATVHFMMKDHARAMADISRTLELEPRHFGAMAGLARILQDSGREGQALAAYQKVLEVYPMLRSAQKAITEISDEMDGQGI